MAYIPPPYPTETISPIMPPIPQVPSDAKFDGAIIIRCGKVNGTGYNHLQLPVNPDEDITYDPRVTMTQTLTGLYFDDYGWGVPTLVLSGNTAWTSPKGMFNGYPANGYAVAKHLYRDIYMYYFQGEHGNSNPTDMEMLIFDYTNNQAWKVKPMPNGFQTSRSKTDPMVIYYTCRFWVIRDLINDPASPDQKIADNVKDFIVRLAPHGRESKQQSPPAQVKQAIGSAKNVSQRPAQTYTVQSGDSLWAIAQKFYGDGNQWQRIYQANSSVVKNPNLIFPGQTLIIPPGPGANKSVA